MTTGKIATLAIVGRKRSQGGAVLVELALVLPILLILSLGTIEVGRAIYFYQKLVGRVMAGGRYLATQEKVYSASSVTDVAADSNTLKAKTACLITTGTATLSCLSASLVPGLSTSNVAISDYVEYTNGLSGSNAWAINAVTIKITGYRYQLLTGSLLSPIFGGTTITFNDVAIVVRQPR